MAVVILGHRSVFYHTVNNCRSLYRVQALGYLLRLKSQDIIFILKRNPEFNRKIHSSSRSLTKTFVTIYSHGQHPHRGPEGCLVSSLTHSSQQLFQSQFYLSKTFTLTSIYYSQEINFPPTQKRK